MRSSLSRAAVRPLRHAPVLLCAAAVLLCLLAPARPARAQVVITTDTTIASAINDSVQVKGSPLVALVTGGSIAGDLSAYDTSTLNVSGGRIDYGLFAYGTSTANVSGDAFIGNLVALDTSTVNVSGGEIHYGLNAGNSSKVNVTGGTIYTLSAYDTSTLTVSGGSVGAYLSAEDNSTVNVSGGSITGDLYVYGSGAVLTVYGSGLSLSGPFRQQDYRLTGTLADGTPLNHLVYLANGATIVQVVLRNKIYPAPVAVNDSAPAVRKGPTTINVLANDFDTYGDAGTATLTVIAVTNGSKGTVVNNGDGTVTYTRNPKAKGNLADSFTYTVSDGQGGTATATVTITAR